MKKNAETELLHSVVTIGTFDGVHLGHQKILKRLVKVATNEQLTSVVLTFFPHPRMVLQPNSNIQLLNTIEERKEILSQSSIDTILIKKFTKEFSELSAHEFVKDILVDELNAKYIIIGYDHQFGKNRSANIHDLKKFGKEFGFEVEEISVKDVEDVAVSSTKIRHALLNGDIVTANRYLGYHYALTGTIIKGKGLGKTIGFPTANIQVDETYKLIPKNGVYAIRGIMEDKVVPGMMNIGTNPTVDGKGISIEAHFFDFEKNLYGKIIKIELIKRLRDEQKFESLEKLSQQLQLDKIEALKVLNTNG